MKYKFNNIYLFLILLLAFSSCFNQSNNVIDVNTLPDITTFATNPTDQFIIDPNDYSYVSNAFPFKGSGTSCSHPGAHLHFTTDGAPYDIAIYAPVDGIINNIEECVDLGPVDRFGIALAFAQHNGNILDFYFSIEPAQQKLCSAGNTNFYSQYILVSAGQKVQKGDIIAYFPKLDTIDSGPHIHFHLGDNAGHYCPNIFNSTIENEFLSLYGFETCSGVAMPATFCYQPNQNENIVNP